MRSRTSVLVVALVVAALPSGAVSLSPTPHPAHPPHSHFHVGTFDPGELAHAQEAARLAYARRDRSGLSGAGRVVTYRAGETRARKGPGGATVRLFSTGALAIEPTLGIAPDGSVFAQAMGQGVTRESVVLRSTNRGSGWRDVSPRVESGDDWKHVWTQDPYLTVDADTGRIFTSDLLFPGPGQMLSFSDDGGDTWTTTVTGVEQTDHQTLFAGPPASGDTTDGYPNAVYNCAANVYATALGSAVTTCTKSLDGGATAHLTGTPPYFNDPTAGEGTADIPGVCSGLTGHGHVGRDGTVYLPRGWCEQPWLAISRDGGLTWSRVQVADNGMAPSDSGPPDEIPQPSHEAAVVADRKGNVYYSWIAADLLPYVAMSRDGGETWSKPIRISPPDVVQTSLPAIAIAPNAPIGKIAAVYMGSTNAPGPPYRIAAADYAGATWNAYLTVTRNLLSRKPIFHTATINDPKGPLVFGKCGTLRCGAEYDFIDVQIGPDGTSWVSAVQGCPGTCPSVGSLVIGRLDGIPLT